MIKETIEIGKFETNQCSVRVLKTLLSYGGENLYIVESTHKKDGFTNVRFGNYLQTQGIINTYKLWGSKRPVINW